ncbi:EF-hand domain-containing family member C2 [Culex quinquefasciatus]|uniref:EF-hand domain-containing family member C2 n=1 Tax=Culex quinquefasciatus TaxID=7176 RepID=UPI0018E36A12|nr:EF-hand domain-containing family member C2 [Culex quinquefasciatus]XP_038119304.1 EF-hand domain-containing family member C2 [Culex quinquefasciatus]XP_038119305.1 EF-hand domain-containing family member C2 [Culex quinquefasciatus]XP_038119306.1 EF-hand domain-containing family member C2 [Culex quinquefasciatus]XP_038119307.1 EF-hand domain-containing family member C2 [Culex quinquefasciatus]
MLRCSGLPFLPGNTFPDLSQTRFHKSHHFDRWSRTCMLADQKRPGIGGKQYSPTDGPEYCLPSLYPPRQGPLLPSWLSYDRKVLCFHGFFQETLSEVDRIPYQIRKVKILYYLEDGTMQVSEPRTMNSGIPQGCLVTRQRIPRPVPYDGEFTSLLDLNINHTVQLFDRVYTITGCDDFTRRFLNRLGVSVPECVEPPIDPSTELRKKQDAAKLAKRPAYKIDTLGKFLEYDRKVLRFQGFWDDRSSLFGDLHELEVLYHLSDDTFEVKEKLPLNSGRDSNGMFLRRGRLPKQFDRLPVMGEGTPVTVLNVLGGGLKGGRYLTDSVGIGKRDDNYYRDADLAIGKMINVYGRTIMLTSCDRYTQDYYRTKFGCEDFTPIQGYSVIRDEYQRRCRRERELPPYNGWGSHEDSEGNCITVEPHPPKIDFRKFVIYDRCNLRFGSRMISKIKENNDRFFVITYYLSDDTVSVYELQIRNSGFQGGEFIKRARVLTPNQDIFTPNRPSYYKAQDFYLGTTVILQDHKFNVTNADIYALKFMESHCEEFPLSNVSKIVQKIRNALQPIYKDYVARHMSKVVHKKIDDVSVATVSYEALRDMLLELLGDQIVDQEIVTLCRQFSAESKQHVKCDKELVRSAVHAELTRDLWHDLQRTKEHLYHQDPTSDGWMTPSQIVKTIKACRIPLDNALIDGMLEVLNRNHRGDIEVSDFLSMLNPIEAPCKPLQPLNIKHDICFFTPYRVTGNLIDWDKLLASIDLESSLTTQT